MTSAREKALDRKHERRKEAEADKPMTMGHRIGLYDETQKLIGYKADTFWTLTTRPDLAKLHRPVSGSIDLELIKNLHIILTHRGRWPEVGVNELIGAIAEANRKRFFGSFETMLIGYDSEGVNPVFTHRVFIQGVQPLTVEDQAKLENELATMRAEKATT